MASAASQSSESEGESEGIYYEYGILGYQYEPLRQDLGSDNEAETEEEDEEEELEEEGGNQEANRIGNMNWCYCARCSVDTLSRERECVCCKEFPSISKDCQQKGKYIVLS